MHYGGRESRKIHYFEILKSAWNSFITLRYLSASFSRIPVTCSVRVHPYTHATHTYLHFAPFVLRGFGCCKCISAKMTCVELHVGVKPAMKLGSRSKVASLRMYVFRDFDMWKRNTPLSCWDFVGQCGVFALQMDVTVLTFSRLKFNYKASRNTQNVPGRFLTEASFFARSAHQRFPRLPRAPKARAKKNWRFCGKYCAKFVLKCGSRVHYSQILGSIPNSLFWHLHCTNPCTKFRPCALPSLVFCFLFFLFLQSKCVVVKLNRVECWMQD